MAGLYPGVFECFRGLCVVCKAYEVLGVCIWRPVSGLGLSVLVCKLSKLMQILSSAVQGF